jgi:hypothetical protein
MQPLLALVLLGFAAARLGYPAEAIRLLPAANAGPEQVKLLGREPTPREREWALLVQWSEIPDGIFQLALPEFSIRLDKTGWTRYVCGHRWQRAGLQVWRSDVPLQFEKPNPLKSDAPRHLRRKFEVEPEVLYQARLQSSAEAFDDRVEIRMQLTNESNQSLDPQIFWVCFLHGWGGEDFNRETVPGISHDTFFFREGRFLPWRSQERDFVFMRASGSALTPLGWKQLQHFRERDGDALPVKRHQPADGLRAALIQRSTGSLVVGLTSPDAAVLGGKIEYPCTDLGLGMGVLEPGATATVHATAWFLKGDLEALHRRTQKR